MGIVSKIYNKWRNRKVTEMDCFCKTMHEFYDNIKLWMKEYPDAEMTVLDHIDYALCESAEYVNEVKNIIAAIPGQPLDEISKKLDTVTAAEFKKRGIIVPELEPPPDWETVEKTIIAGIDITKEAFYWKARNHDTPYPLCRQFTAALEKAGTIEELRALKKFLLEHRAELKDLISHAQEPSGDNVSDMSTLIDECIAEKKSGHFIT